jgi:hypothetical protein
VGWTDKDAIGLGVIVRWQVRGEKTPRVWPGEKDPFWLTQCYPLNSPLWATDARTQISYLAIRRFANLTAPGILGSAAFDHEDLLDASERARDITPVQEEAGSQTAESVVENDVPWTVYDEVGQAYEFRTGQAAGEAIRRILNHTPHHKVSRSLSRRGRTTRPPWRISRRKGTPRSPNPHASTWST